MSFWKNLHPLLRKDKDDYGSANSAILNAIDTSLSDAERAEVATKVQRSLETATGEYLDYWGRWFNTARREDETDDTYRERIKYYLLMGRGTVQGIIDGLKYWLQDNALYAEVYEPWYNIFTLNKSKLNGEDSIAGSYYRYAVIDVKLDRPISKEILDIIYAYKPAGVILYTTYEPDLNIKANALTLANLNTNFKEQTLANYGGIGDYGGNIIGFGDLDEAVMQSMNHNLFTTNDSKTNGEDYISSNIFSGKTPYLHTAWSWSSDGKDRFTVAYPGENLLLDSAKETSVVGNGGPSLDFGRYNYKFSFGNISNIPAKAGDSVTFSADVLVTGTSPSGILQFQPNDTPWGGLASSISNISDFTIGEKKRVTVSIMVPSYWLESTNKATGIMVAMNNVPTTIAITVSNWKFEIGNMSTDWSPAPSEDPINAYPIYRGEYTDYTATDSTDPAKYTWVKVKDPQDSTISDSDIGAQKPAYYVGLSGAHRNLILGTADYSGWAKSNALSIDSSAYPNVVHYPLTTTNDDFLQKQGIAFFEPSTSYTLTFKAKGSGPLSVYVYPNVSASNPRDNAHQYQLTSDYKIYSFSFVTDSDISGTKNVLFRNLNSTLEAYITQVKLEKGNTSTAWSPAPEDNVVNLPDSSPTWVQDGIRQATKLEDNVKSGNIFNNGNNNIFGEIRIQEFLLSKYSIKDSGNILATSTLSPYIEVSGVLRGNANIVVSQVSYPILNGRTLIPIKTSDITRDSVGISKIPFCLVGEEGTTLDLDKIVFGYKFLREKETGVAVSADHVIKSVK